MLSWISRQSKTFWLALVFLCLATLLAACGDSANTSVSSPNSDATSKKSSLPAAATTAANSNEAAASLPGQPAKPAITALLAERKIIRNAALSIQVNDIEESLTKLRKLAVEQGGFVFSENTSQLPGELPKSLIVLQVPSETYEITVNRIRADSVKVLKHESSSQDVTEEFIDVQGQITNLRKTEESIQKLLDKATTLSEITTVQKELTAIRGEIEKRQGRLNFLDKKSALSTISIDLSLVPAPASVLTPVAKPQAATWQPEKTASESWDASLKLLGGFGTVLLQVLIFGWWLLPFALIAFFWWRSRRTARRRSTATFTSYTPANVASSEQPEVLLKK